MMTIQMWVKTWLIAASVGFAGIASSVHGTIVYSGPQNLTLEQGSGEQIWFNFAGASDAFRIVDERGGFGMIEELGNGSYSYLLDDVPLRTIVTAFDFGDEINPELEWTAMVGGALLGRYASESEFGPGNFFDRTDRYLPLRTAYDDNEYFGWLRISHSFEDEVFTIHDWAWNSATGEPILAGQIPEPAAYAVMFGVGVLVFVIFQRRRRNGSA